MTHSVNPGGVNVGGVNVGVPGMGRVSRRGMGNADNAPSAEPPRLTLRWESALTIRSAELKVHDKDAPSFDENHYAIAVYGVPDQMLEGESKKLQEQLRKDAALKRDGKKDLRPSSVEVLDRPNGPLVLYLFPNSAEISKADRRVEFAATIGRLSLAQSFFIDEMVWQGRIAL
jgi:hypothetical protein